MGFMFGSPFGIIGAGAGTILGFIYGHLARRDADAKAEVDAQRQEAADADLERQIDERNANGAGRTEAKATPARKQGVIIVKDHLADSPGRRPAGSDPSGTGPMPTVSVPSTRAVVWCGASATLRATAGLTRSFTMTRKGSSCDARSPRASTVAWTCGRTTQTESW